MAVPPKPHPAPAFVTPMAARAVKALPEGRQWLYEPKLDGYRALLLKDQAQIRMLSRNEKDLTAMYPGIAAAGLRLNAGQVVIDGEIVALAEDGRPSFQALQHRASHPKHSIVFYAFDVLYLNGRNLMGEPLVKRRAQLPGNNRPNPTPRFSPGLPRSAAAPRPAPRRGRGPGGGGHGRG